ncbi:MAG TPA: GNAT family N-acetyltransferase [Bryobacteraceae bacterium]|jgi:predicted acetyltransferase|nr:GNAT family N-acetyltransferase [Bryobacteraceae bacterium]
MHNIEVIPATVGQSPILANLLELYVHDFSEFFDVEIGANGKFGYPPLPLYWTEEGRHPFLIRVNGKLAGLVLVKKSGAVWDMAEFFVIRGCRRNGIGIYVAHQVWQRFPGAWEVRVMTENRAARQFWARAISAFAGEPVSPVSFEKDGVNWELFSFESTGPSLSPKI